MRLKISFVICVVVTASNFAHGEERLVNVRLAAQESKELGAVSINGEVAFEDLLQSPRNPVVFAGLSRGKWEIAVGLAIRKGTPIGRFGLHEEDLFYTCWTQVEFEIELGNEGEGSWLSQLDCRLKWDWLNLGMEFQSSGSFTEDDSIPWNNHIGPNVVLNNGKVRMDVSILVGSDGPRGAVRISF